MAAFSGSRGAQARGASDGSSARSPTLLGDLRAADRLLRRSTRRCAARHPHPRARARADRHLRPRRGGDVRRDRRPLRRLARGRRQHGARLAPDDRPGDGRRPRRARPRLRLRGDDGRAVNMALLFDPDGKLVSKQVKAYLTPVELPGQLDLVPGDPRGLTAVDTPVGTLGFVTSKDAWMPDVTGRLDDAGVEMLVQPEFFVGDTSRTTGPWAPDTLEGVGLLRRAAPPVARGDGAARADRRRLRLLRRRAVAHRGAPAPGGPRGGLVGQDPAPGLAQVQPWLGDRPRRLRRRDAPARGGRRPPARPAGRGRPHADVEVGARRERRPGRAPPRPARSRRRARAAQRRARRARPRRSSPPGSEAAPIRTRARARGRVVAARGRAARAPHRGRVGAARWLAYDARRRQGRRRARPRTGRSRSAPGERAQERPAIAALGERRGLRRLARRPRRRARRLRRAGRRPRPSGSTRPPVELAEQLDHSWAPHVAARGKQVLVTLGRLPRLQVGRLRARVERRRRRRSAPRCASTTRPTPIEALDDTPQAGFLRGDPFVAWTDFRKRTDPAPSPLYDIYGARAGAGQRGSSTATARASCSAFAPAVAAAAAGRPGRRLAGPPRPDRGHPRRARSAARPPGRRRGRSERQQLAPRRRRPAGGACWWPGRTIATVRRNFFARTLVLPSAPSP